MPSEPTSPHASETGAKAASGTPSLTTLRDLANLTEQMYLNRLRFYQPYPKQRLFHYQGKTKTLRLFMAGNQLGKSDAGGAETAMHLTGRYLKGWPGRVFKHPIRAWAAGVTGTSTRDIVQQKLMGDPGAFGSGFIPADCIIKAVPSRALPNALDFVRVKHISGGESIVYFKSYEQGMEKWQGAGIDWIWLDEEPRDFDIWMEALARITATRGSIALTFTPLQGVSRVVKSFFPKPDSSEKSYARMEIHEARHEDGTSHLTDEMIQQILQRYPASQRDARLRGLPLLGSGLVFDGVVPEDILEDPPTIGMYWRKIGAIDFGGGTHPTAYVQLAHDTEADVIHLIHSYKKADPRVAVHASSILMAGRRVPCAWPKDGHQRQDRQGGKKLKDLYAQHGLLMLRDHSQYPDGNVGVEDGVADILDRMQTGRFKVSYHHRGWWEEFNMYHRKDNVIVKEFDDLMSATRYGVMSIRYARTVKRFNSAAIVTRGLEYDPISDFKRRKINPSRWN
jgi:phage terminase large subunit-like protein